MHYLFTLVLKSSRFIREWDRPDRDPATSTRVLATFRETLHTLFVQGYIPCKPGADDSGAEGLGAIVGPKTITQISMEQRTDALIVRVGSKEKRLWSHTGKAEALEVMAEIKSIVADVVARLDADFSTNALYLCFEAFDLLAWQKVQELGASGVGAEANAERLNSLRRKAHRLCEALQTPWSFQTWTEAVRVALSAQRNLPDDTEQALRNRVAWAEAIASSQGPETHRHARAVLAIEPVICFYLSFRDGTGDVERGLGKFLAMQAQHTGAPDGEVCFPEACLEVWQEGAQVEGLIAAAPQQEGGVLQLTPFSKECALLWLARFGRRFACQKKAKRCRAKAPAKVERLTDRCQSGSRVGHSIPDQISPERPS